MLAKCYASIFFCKINIEKTREKKRKQEEKREYTFKN